MSLDKEMIWRNAATSEIVDIESIVKRYTSMGIPVSVGTDSMYHVELVLFVTSVCFHSRDHNVGDYYISSLEAERDDYSSLFRRLSKEVELSVCAAESIRSKFEDAVIELHVDISPDPKNKSNVLINQAMGWEGYKEFKIKVKPEAWAASGCADWHTK